jgi:phytol kinase
MDNNIAGLIVSFVFLGGVIVLGFALGAFAHVSGETVRKTIHIGVSNWWFVEMAFFTRLEFALVGPVFFIVANSLFTFLDLGSALGVGDRKRNLGLIYFPVTLVLFVLLQYNGILSSVACLVGVLVMGYGDGFAALAGTRWGSKKLPIRSGGKTWMGTVVMFAVSFVVCLVLLSFHSTLPPVDLALVSLLVGGAAALVEALTPLGLDNLSVPIVSAFIAGVFV